MIAIGGSAVVALTIACVLSQGNPIICVALPYISVMWLICKQFCYYPCRPGCAVYGW